MPLGSLSGGAKPAISHFAIFGFNPEKQENSLKVSTNILTEEMSLRKKVESSAYVVNKNVKGRIHCEMLLLRHFMKY